MENSKIHIISLGCPKNLVDSEYLLGLLADRGIEVTEDPDDAGTVVINTCGFIQSAVEESIQTVLEAAAPREAGEKKIIAVFGCLPQRYKNELAESLPEVDLFWGSGSLEKFAERLAERIRTGVSVAEDRKPAWTKPGFCPDTAVPRLRSAPFYRAYLKIAEGCSNVCSYCMIPRLRGPLKSRPGEILVQEAAALAESGVRELILVAQDTTAYGRDLDKGTNLASLLKDLASIPSLAWIRIMYAYPTGLTDELTDLMAREPRICKYLDIPLQHASANILKRMKRDHHISLPELMANLRERVPGIRLRTTMMTGFPGETDEDFRILTDFVEKCRFDHLGVFKFSPENGVPASGYPDQVPQRIKENRRRKLMAVQRRISRDINRAFIGRKIPVLVEGFCQETELLLTGRTQGQAPEIDGQVFITSGTASPGEIRDVLITGSHDYDLIGELAD